MTTKLAEVDRAYKRRVDRIQLVMRRGPMTVPEIAPEICLSKARTYTVMRELCKDGMVHVSGYREDLIGRKRVKVYRWGRGDIAKRPGTRPYQRKRIGRNALPEEIGRQQSMARILAALGKQPKGAHA